VYFRPPIIRDATIILAVLEHARERRYPQPIDGLARVQRDIDIHDLVAPG